MLKTYPVDFVEQRRKMIVWSVVIGLIGAILFFVADVLEGHVLLIGLAGVVSLGSLGTILWNAGKLIGLSWCDGDVLEVEGEMVLAHHEEPFFYQVKSLGARRLVPLKFKKKVETGRTLHMAIRGGIFLCELQCVVVLSDLQQFYNAFLWSERRIKPDPKSVVSACICTFLHQWRDRILEDFHQDENRSAGVLSRTQADAREYLQGELCRFGLVVDSIQPKPSLQVNFIR